MTKHKKTKKKTSKLGSQPIQHVYRTLGNFLPESQTVNLTFEINERFTGGANQQTVNRGYYLNNAYDPDPRNLTLGTFGFSRIAEQYHTYYVTKSMCDINFLNASTGSACQPFIWPTYVLFNNDSGILPNVIATLPDVRKGSLLNLSSGESKTRIKHSMATNKIFGVKANDIVINPIYKQNTDGSAYTAGGLRSAYWQIIIRLGPNISGGIIDCYVTGKIVYTITFLGKKTAYDAVALTNESIALGAEGDETVDVVLGSTGNAPYLNAYTGASGGIMYVPDNDIDPEL